MKANRRGFTLIEMLVVVAIISMLAAIVAYNMIGNLDWGRLQGTKGQIENLSLALEQYKTDLGSYPPSDWLADAMEKGLGASLKWHGPYYKFETAQTGFVDASGNLIDRRNSPLQFFDGSNAESMLLPNRSGAKVYLDQFDRPIIYIPHYEYPSKLAIRDFNDINETYYNRTSFQLFSFGKDGRSKAESLLLFDDGVDNDGDGVEDKAATLKRTQQTGGNPEDDVSNF